MKTMSVLEIISVYRLAKKETLYNQKPMSLYKIRESSFFSSSMIFSFNNQYWIC